MVKREHIIQRLKETLEPQRFIYALWLEGADALKTLDDYSDIDVWLDVEPPKIQEAFTLIREALLNLGALALEFDVHHPDAFIEQRFFQLQNSSKFLLVDVCIQSHERTTLFNPELDAVKVLFDKATVIRFGKPIPVCILERVKRLKEAYLLYSIRLEKYLIRAEYLSANSTYQTYIFTILIELLRLKYCPLKAAYGTKDIYSDLPLAVCKRLETLQNFSSLSDLETQSKDVNHWTQTLISDLSP